MTDTRNRKWLCPVCRRLFTRKNQIHSCELYSIKDHHLKKADPETIQIFNYLIDNIQKFGTVLLEPLKNIIAIKKKSQFCTIQVQKRALKIIFRLYSHLSSSRFSTMSQQKDTRYYYQLKIQTLAEIDAEFISWLHQAYDEN
jgi:predicted transport protein